ncbi:MAG: hypothetical protein Q8Q28_09440 [Pseudomonadota bacterium]|nr:hypothetical protein [Pseudomonadota bacterium]
MQMRDGERMDETQLRRLMDQAPRQVRALLAGEGFYSPQVHAEPEQSSGTWRNPGYLLGSGSAGLG